MQVQFKVFLDGERKPSVKGVSGINAILDKYIDIAKRAQVIAAISKGEKVDFTDRRHGARVVFANVAMKAKVKADSERMGFLKVSLQGIKTTPQIKVAAADALKSADGWHRTVVLVKANGLEYKVKCKHKGLTYTECVYQCVIVSKRAI